MGNAEICECKRGPPLCPNVHVCTMKLDHDFRICGCRTVHICAAQYCKNRVTEEEFLDSGNGPYCPEHGLFARRCQICKKPKINIREDDGVCYDCCKVYCNNCGKSSSPFFKAWYCDDCALPCGGKCMWVIQKSGRLVNWHPDAVACIHHNAQQCQNLRVVGENKLSLSPCLATIPFPGPKLCHKCTVCKPERLALIERLQACDVEGGGGVSPSPAAVAVAANSEK